MKQDLSEPLLEKKVRTDHKGTRLDAEGFKTPRWLGYLYQILFVLLICLQQLFGKFLFTRTPEMSPTQLLFIRSITAALIFTAVMNKNIGYYMYTSIDKKHYGNVAIRVAIGIMMLVCIYTSVKYLPLVYVSLVSNLAPLLTALFSYIFLKKGLGRLDSALLIVSFFGVVLMITGAQDSGPSMDQALHWTVLIIPIITLLLQPILGAASSIMLRQLRELSEITLGAYMSWSMVLIYGPICLLTPSQGFGYLSNFEWLDWTIVTILGFTSSLVQICRAKASQYEEPAKLSVINYFQAVFQLSFDILFFNTPFSFIQIAGIAVVLGGASIKWGLNIQRFFLKKGEKKKTFV